MRRWMAILSAGSLLALAVHGCGGEGPVSPEVPVVESANRTTPALSLESVGLTAVELLSDPMLHLMLQSLRDPTRAARIITAVDAVQERLARGEIEAARAHLDNAYGALERYVGTGEDDDEDVIYLDAAERFLDAVADLIGTQAVRSAGRGRRPDPRSIRPPRM